MLDALAVVRDAVDDVLRWVAGGALLGQLIGYRRHRRCPDLDPFLIVTRWTFVGLAVGFLVAVWSAL